ncbi:MAG: PA2779 family protein [Marinospirillum sp.]|uniref:PA2779 family protein n=1 Tax=Marinospirillum sp. TaxID=2183934 RepID=UPI001A08CD03|nr:PA2779 family protein [Marinospirillum sp.]MBE0505495.1 PA2779 family protein [Marinospirillum sp.]
MKLLLKTTVFSLLMLFVTLSAQAGLISNQQLLQQTAPTALQLEWQQQLSSPQAKAQLMALGVDPVAAQARIERLTPEELAQLQARMDELPAGSGVLGVVVVVFVVFIITDLLGATDIFPFVRSVNH